MCKIRVPSQGALAVSVLSQSQIQELVALLQAGQGAKAVSSAKRLIDKFPQSAVLHFLLGVGLASQQKLDPAIHSYRKALSLNPQYFEALNNLGVALRQQGRLNEAADTYAAALTLQPNSADVVQNLGKVFDELGSGFFEQGHYGKAVEAYRKAVALKPGDPHHLTNLGVALFHLGQFKEAQDYLRRVLSIDAVSVKALAHLALATRALGEPYADVLEHISRAPSVTTEDLSAKMWAGLNAGNPELAFSLKPPGFNVMPFAELGSLYRQQTLASRIEALPKLEGTRPKPGARPLLFASMDGKYAKIFARDLIASALSKCPDSDFHLHLMNPGGFMPESLQRDRVTCTTETMPADKTLYSTRRFVRLVQLLDERPIIAVDADCVINGDILAALPAQFDVITYDRPDQPWAHQMVNAGFLAISPRARDFAAFLAGYILHFENAAKSAWFVDQLGIVSARAWFQKNVPDISIQSAPRHMMDWNAQHSSESLIWHAKGRLKPVT